MICTKCGAEIPEGAKFCINCGNAAVAAEPAPQVEQPVYEAPQQPVYEAPQQQPVYAAAPQQPQYQQPQYQQPQYQQPQYQQPTYYAQPQPAANVSGKPALTFGILGIIFACTFYFSFLGIIFSAIGLGKAKAFRAAAGQLSGPAKVGKILSTIGLIVGIILTVICLIVVIGLIAEYA
jgi:hypothetical protein